MRARTIGWAGAVIGVLVSVSGQAQERRMLPTRQAQHAASLAAAGRLPATQHMDVTLTLQLRNIDELTSLLDRKVDLLEEAALRNPYRRSAILQTKHVLYAA